MFGLLSDRLKDEEAFSEDIFGFHIQQAIEKTLKAWLADEPLDRSRCIEQVSTFLKHVDAIFKQSEMEG